MSLLVQPLEGVPEIADGDELAAVLAPALRALGARDGDVVAVSSKVVSKALGLRRPAAEREAELDRATVRVVAERSTPRGTTRVVEAVAGPVMAAAGIDASNTGPEEGILLLPEDPDGAAAELRAGLLAELGLSDLGVLLTDTAGRPWRDGQTDLALGAAGVRVLDDLRGAVDADGRDLAVTARAVGDELAAAADLVKGKAEGIPAALLRGPGLTGEDAARRLVRTGPGDWFALGHREAVRAALGAAPGTAEAAQVGLPSVLPETDEVRCARAVRLALLGHEGVEVVPTDQGYEVRSGDPVRAGRVAARLETALRGEDVAAVVTVVA